MQAGRLSPFLHNLAGICFSERKGLIIKHDIELQARLSMIKKGPYKPGLSDREEHAIARLNQLSI